MKKFKLNIFLYGIVLEKHAKCTKSCYDSVDVIVISVLTGNIVPIVGL